jgi:hypothetical protein
MVGPTVSDLNGPMHEKFVWRELCKTLDPSSVAVLPLLGTLRIELIEVGVIGA